MSSAKWRPFYLGPKVLRNWTLNVTHQYKIYILYSTINWVGNTYTDFLNFSHSLFSLLIGIIAMEINWCIRSFGTIPRIES